MLGFAESAVYREWVYVWLCIDSLKEGVTQPQINCRLTSQNKTIITQCLADLK